MRARIIQHTKKANNGAPTPQEYWQIEFEYKDGSLRTDPISGWLSNSDMRRELNLKFTSQEAAELYAKTNNLEYEIIGANIKKMVKRSYADNFK